MLTASAPSEPGTRQASNDHPTKPAIARVEVVWRIVLFLLLVQAIAMLVFTTAQYGRFDLTNDFGAYAQAWTAIAHGHMSPFSSLFGVLFWRNDLELLMWPLALFYWIYPHAVTLLWLQVLAVVGGELVVVMWARDIVKARLQDHVLAPVALGLVAGLLVLSPWSWYTIGFDFHLEAFTALFALLAARDLWAGRYSRSLIVWVPLTLLSAAAPGALLVIGLGIVSLLRKESPRRIALVLVAVGFGWLALADALGAMRFGGLQMSSMYGYLSGQTSGHLGVPGVIGGLMTDPMAAVRMFGSHVTYVIGYIAAAGVIGLFSRWGLVIAGVVLLPSALNGNPNFIHFTSSFQNWPAVLFLIAAYAMALERFARDGRLSRSSLYGVAAITIALAAAVTYQTAGRIPGYIERVSPAAASELSALQRQIPSNAEVIASQGIVGRLGVGHVAFSYWAQGVPETYPVDSGPVVFVLTPTQGTAEGFANETRRAILYAASDLKAQVIAQGHGIWAFRWMPSVGTHSVVVP